LPVLPLFVALMVASAFRNVSTSALATKVPGPRERARFMSIQSAVQHAASAAGGFLSARLLSDRPDRSLDGMSTVAATSSLCALGVLPLLWLVERRVRARNAHLQSELAPDSLPPSHAH
jgi:predicted MFS family arabinose efflux permease